MIYRFRPLLSNHYLKTESTNWMKTIFKAHPSTAFLKKDFVVGMLMYFRAEIIFAYGNLHPVAGKLQLSLWEVSTAIVGSSFPAKQKEVFFLVFYMSGCFRATRLKSLNIVILLVCYQPRLSFVALPLFLCQSQPPVSTASLLFPLPFNQALPWPWIATVLSTFNYDHTVQGFESLSCRAGRFLITKLISK